MCAFVISCLRSQWLRNRKRARKSCEGKGRIGWGQICFSSKATIRWVVWTTGEPNPWFEEKSWALLYHLLEYPKNSQMGILSKTSLSTSLLMLLYISQSAYKNFGWTLKNYYNSLAREVRQCCKTAN